MGRRKWKLYQDGLLPRRNDSERSSEDESMPATDGPPPALKIKTIEQINAPEDGVRPKIEQEQNTVAENTDVKPARAETILETLIRKPATQPKLEYAEEPTDWKPADKCYFCVDGDRGEATGAESRPTGGATSPASESDSSSVSGARSPAAAPQLLHHLLQMQSPQAIAQFQQMMAALAALGSGLVPPALSQAWLMQRLAQSRQQAERLPSESSDKVPLPDSSPSMSSEQPLDLSAKSSSTAGSPPPITKNHDNSRLNNLSAEGSSAGTRRAYTEDELKSALRDIQSGKLGTRRASVVYGIPRSTLRNKVYKLTADPGPESEPDSDPDRPDSPPSVILKIPTFPVPDDNKSSSPGAGPLPGATFAASLSAPPRPPLLLPPSVFADPPPSQQIFTSLSDVIAKSISQKFQQHPQAPAEHPFIRAPDRHVSVIKTPPEGPRPFPAPSNSRANNNNNNGQQPPGGKGTRPKRGKYRNYDRDSLVEAVKAVQRGEMSVHRAGSYYGVPHSTLEYKVKERHLMRPRKREPKPQPQDNGKPQPPKPPPPKPPVKPFANGLNGPEAGYPGGYFWPPSGFPPPPAPELYASHMMRRLREEAPPANGSFLEGIIRSSLERPSAALLQRLTAPADEPPPRRPRLHSADRHLADEMRETVQRLREGRSRNGDASPEPPPPDRP